MNKNYYPDKPYVLEELVALGFFKMRVSKTSSTSYRKRLITQWVKDNGIDMTDCYNKTDYANTRKRAKQEKKIVYESMGHAGTIKMFMGRDIISYLR